MTVKPSLFDTGIRPVIDEHLAKLSEEVRDYGDYWSASSAGKCNRLVIFERLNIPYVIESARKQRVFSAGDVFHEWIQRITKDAGISIGQEILLQDEELMVRGHADDLVKLDKLILYDYKSTHSASFHRGKNRYPLSYYHKMQVGTYLYMLNQLAKSQGKAEVTEARILKISKDDLCMDEHQVLWTASLKKEVYAYWTTLNGYWKKLEIPECTCEEHEGGFMARPAWNPYWYKGEPCSLVWYEENLSSLERIK